MTRRAPNVLLIVSDDHGYADRSAGGTPGVRTPALDRLAAEGATFSDAYVTAPICSPSRAAIISGQYQQRWGALWFDSAEIGDVPTIAEQVRSAGYATGYFGKVHYGSETEKDRGAPPRHGFDESFYGLAGQSMGRLHYRHHTAEAVGAYGQSAEAMGVQPFWSGTEPAPFDGFTTTEIAERAIGFIERHEHEPFFAMIAFNAVHNFCWQLPDDERAARGLPEISDWDPGASEYLDWYDGAISPRLPDGRAFYLAQLELMDREIGRVLDHLDQAGLAEDTIVVYLTDNGGSQCNYGDNGTLRGSKYTVWEGGVRVPFLVRWPGVSPQGATIDVPVSALDLAPTIAAAAGVAPRPFSDGTDLRPILHGTPTEARDLHWECGWQWAVRRGPWKLSWFDAASPTARYVCAVEHTETGDGLQLFDLRVDPGEQHDVASAHPEIVDDLLARHQRWRAEMGLAAPGPV